ALAAMLSVAFPELVSETDCGELCVATRWLLKVRLEGARVIAGALMPKPVSETDCGLPTALSVNVSAPLRVPVAVGLKVTLIVQEASGARPVPQLLVCEKSPEAATTRLMMGRTGLVFVRTTGWAELEVPTGWLAKLTALVERVTVGAETTLTLRVA